MKRLVFAICLTAPMVPATASAQLLELRQTIFGMD
jgi:hypothetical protein